MSSNLPPDDLLQQLANAVATVLGPQQQQQPGQQPGQQAGPQTPPVPATSPSSLAGNLQIALQTGALYTAQHLASTAVSGAAGAINERGTGNVLGGMFESAVSPIGYAAQGAAAGAILGGPLAPVTAAIGAIAGVAAALSTLPAKIMEWSNALVESQRDLAAYSGTLQRIFGERERGQILRGIESAQATGGTTSALSSQYDKLLDTLQPVKDDVRNILNLLMTGAVATLNADLKLIELGNHVLTMGADVLVRKALEAINKYLGSGDDSTSFTMLQNYLRHPVNSNRVAHKP